MQIVKAQQHTCGHHAASPQMSSMTFKCSQYTLLTAQEGLYQKKYII